MVKKVINHIQAKYFLCMVMEKKDGWKFKKREIKWFVDMVS